MEICTESLEESWTEKWVKWVSSGLWAGKECREEGKRGGVFAAVLSPSPPMRGPLGKRMLGQPTPPDISLNPGLQNSIQTWRWSWGSKPQEELRFLPLVSLLITLPVFLNNTLMTSLGLKGKGKVYWAILFILWCSVSSILLLKVQSMDQQH